MTTFQPLRHPLPMGLGFLLMLFGFPGCSNRPVATVMMASEGIEVVVKPSPTDERGVFEWTLRHAKQAWTLRTRIPDLAAAKSLDNAQARAVLGRFLTWNPPYLFVREDTGHREGSRATVDHVFKCEGTKVARLGTLAAGTGAPGSQFAGGRFRDAYDRLEFSPLAAPDHGPVFPIFLLEKNGRLRADTEATWNESREEFEKRRNNLHAQLRVSDRPGESPTVSLDSRAAMAPRATRVQGSGRADALYCLAIARYCDREPEYNQVLELSRKRFDAVDEWVEEIETIVPGELAASRDEVLRANPALVNFFKESAEEPPEPEMPSLPRIGASATGLPEP